MMPKSRNSGWISASDEIPSAEEVRHRHDVLDLLGVAVPDEADRRDDDDVDGGSGSRRFAEAFRLVADVFRRLSVEADRFGRELHFAQVDDPVVALQHQIDLRARTPVRGRARPRGNGREDAGDAESGLDPVYVLQADQLEGDSLPCGADGPTERMRPEPFVPSDVLPHERVVEEDERIDELIERPCRASRGQTCRSN